ncbi:MAG: hypothetical protein NUV34_04745 [Sulfuricaulis sp.]|nr:hypothetical protein [Sulfuricaulis sp.]
MNHNRLLTGLRMLRSSDRQLLLSFVALSLLTLGLGTVYGIVTAFGRAGFVELEALVAYKALTLHGVTIFFYCAGFSDARRGGCDEAAALRASEKRQGRKSRDVGLGRCRGLYGDSGCARVVGHGV